MRSSAAPQPLPLPAGLPVPVDDGAAAHLEGRHVPSVRLEATTGGTLDLADLAADRLVLFVYPKMGRPDIADPPGWDDIPGARGCTQQSCAFRDLYQDFMQLGYRVAGLSAQSSDEQREAAGRLHLTYPLLADPEHRAGRALWLPTFAAAGMTLYKRLALVTTAGRIKKVFYPVFPPNENASEVLRWIEASEPL